jgi:hypothetical protein
MGSEMNSKIIGDTEFFVNEMNPFEALDLIADVADILGPIVGGAMASKSIDTMLDSELSELNLPMLIQSFTRAIDKARLKSITQQMMKLTKVQLPDKMVSLDTGVFQALFKGNLMNMFQWLWFALEVQLGDFFGDLVAVLKNKIAAVSASLSLSTSPDTGSVGVLLETNE